MQKKQGISLIVLVITIIVMIILAASVVITLSNTGVINRASQAVDLTNEAAVQDLAALTWADAYMDNLRGQSLIDKVTEELEEQGVTADNWTITVTDTGVVVKKNKGNESEKEEYSITVYSAEGIMVDTVDIYPSIIIAGTTIDVTVETPLYGERIDSIVGADAIVKTKEETPFGGSYYYTFTISNPVSDIVIRMTNEKAPPLT